MRKLILAITLLFIASSAWASDWVDGKQFDEFEVTQWDGIAAPSVSATNTGRIYYDSTSDTLKLSLNGGAYADIATSGMLAAYLKLDCSNDPLTDGLQITMPAATAQGLYVDGATNDFTGAATGITVNLTRDLNIGAGNLQNYAGIQNYLNPKHTSGKLDADHFAYAAINRVDNDGTVVNNTAGVKYYYEYGDYAWIDNDGTIDTSAAGQAMGFFCGLSSKIDIDTTFTDTGGTTPATQYATCGLDVDIDSTPTLTSGAVSPVNYGVRIDVDGSATGSSAAYGIYIMGVSGCDVNYAVYDNSGAPWIIATGYVGIGTGVTLPSAPLDVRGVGIVGASIDIVNAGTAITNVGGLTLSASNATLNNYVGVLFSDNVSAAAGASGHIGMQLTDRVNHYGDLSFATRSAAGYTEKMKISSAGVITIPAASSVDAGAATSLEIPNAADPDLTVEGQISWDTDDDWLRGIDANAGNQVVVGQKAKIISFTVCNPDLLTETAFVPIWTNQTGATFNITGIYSVSDTDDADYTLKYTTNDYTDETNLTTIEAITISTNGTGCFYNAKAVGDIDDTTVETNKTIGYDNSADDVDFIHGIIVGYLDGDVN